MAVISEKGKRNLKQSENKPSRGRRLLPGDRLCILLLPTSTTSEYKANADSRVCCAVGVGAVWLVRWAHSGRRRRRGWRKNKASTEKRKLPFFLVFGAGSTRLWSSVVLFCFFSFAYFSRAPQQPIQFNDYRRWNCSHFHVFRVSAAEHQVKRVLWLVHSELG